MDWNWWIHHLEMEQLKINKVMFDIELIYLFCNKLIKKIAV